MLEEKQSSRPRSPYRGRLLAAGVIAIRIPFALFLYFMQHLWNSVHKLEEQISPQTR